MKQTIKAILSDTRDLIAVLLVVTYCITIFLPEHYVSLETQDYFNTLMMMVLGYFFGRATNNNVQKHQEQPRNNKDNTCVNQECDNRKRE